MQNLLLPTLSERVATCAVATVDPGFGACPLRLTVCSAQESAQPNQCQLSGPHRRQRWHTSRSVETRALAAPERPAMAPRSTPQCSPTYLCTIATAAAVADACDEILQASQCGSTAVELRLDFYTDFNADQPERQLQSLLDACQAAELPCICTCRPHWEGGKFLGNEEKRLNVLKMAAYMGAQHVDVELKAAAPFFSGYRRDTQPGCKIILSSHNFHTTPPDHELSAVLRDMYLAGADIAKIATTALDITDALRLLAVLKASPGPTIALAMGERGLISRLLAPKYGSYLTFGSLGSGKESAPGQPTVEQLRFLFRLPAQKHDTKVYGIVGNPVGHSRSPLLHNAGFDRVGYNAVYVPLLVDDLQHFLAHPLAQDFAGLSVTIPHKEAALQAADQVDPIAAQIGAVNTLVRSSYGHLSAYNSDWGAAISAIEDGLRGSSSAHASTSRAESSSDTHDVGEGEASPLRGRRVVVLGAGGAARALVFGALAAGAHVTIVNRSRQRAESLALAAGGQPAVADMQHLLSGQVRGDVLINVTSVGMHPHVHSSPVPETAALQGFMLVFDAIYTPMVTQLLKDAREEGCIAVSGAEMFVRQALQQFEHFAGQKAPAGLFRRLLLEGLSQQ